MKTTILLFSVCAGTLLPAANVTSAEPPAPKPTDDTQAYFEVLRSDFNPGKIRLINEVLKMTGPEAEAFWPVYQQYEKELAAVGNEKLALIRDFMTHHKNGTLQDPNAKNMAEKWLKNVQARLDLWKKYHKQISEALSPVRGAQFLQVENQMALFVDAAIASEMPHITPATPPASAK